MTQITRSNGRTKVLQESVEQVWLAGLGALALTEEEGSKFFRSLVKKGETVERRSRARVDGALAAAKRAPSTAITKLERGTDEVFQQVMHRIGVPTRKEIAGLTKRIEGLTATIERKPSVRRAASKPRSRKAASSEQTAATA
jgi:poly(hydroxyalkanoate) granule-associated protein